MGYYVTTEKINMVLTKEQQDEIFNNWKQYLSMTIPLPLSLVEYKNQINNNEIKNCEDFLKEIGFTYSKDENHTITLIDGSYDMEYQRALFKNAEHLFTSGSYIHWRGEDLAFFGWFFNHELINYSSKKEFKILDKELKEKLTFVNNLKNDLEKKQQTEISKKFKV